MMKKLYATVAAAAALTLTSCSSYTLVDSQTYNSSALARQSTFRIYYPTEATDMPPGMDMVTYYNIAAAVREQMLERGFTESATSPMVINLAITVKKELATAPLSSVLPPPPPPAPPIIINRPAPAPPPPPAGRGPAAPDNGATTPPTTTSSRGNHFYVSPAIRPVPSAQPYFMYPRRYYWNNPALYGTEVVTGIYREGVLTMDMFDISTRTALYSASVATILDNGDTQFRNLKGIAEAVQTLFSKFPIPLQPKYKNQ